MARYALAAIPGPAVNEALRNSLGRAPNERSKIGIINSLGHRKDAKAVPVLAALISSVNPAVTAAAVAALANIADRAAREALAAARTKAGNEVRNLITEGYLVAADRSAERGETATATNVYKQMLASGEPRMIRTRALAGLTAVNTKAAVPVLTVEIESKDPELQAAAIKLLNSIPGPDVTKVMVKAFPKLPPLGQVQLLTAMAHRGDTAAKPTIQAALMSEASAARAAALAGLGKLGDESSVTILAKAAASGQGKEQNAARRSLYSLRGPGIDRALISAMGSSSGKVKVELIMAAGERAATSAADALTRAARETDPDVRSSSLRALRNVGGAGQTPALLDLLLNASTTTER
ncbi:MAG: HEAT repeat domain-containing protein, partial [bacterium]|nr:HEAT repeat domain-containing protein [bacterium]